jgi:hypothetical protein
MAGAHGAILRQRGILSAVNLDDFIKLTLSQIIKGVEEAGAQSKGKVAPEIGMGEDDPKILRTSPTHGHHGVFLVEFDVALTASDKSERSGSAGMKVYVVTAEGGKTKIIESSSAHRIKFSVPISYQLPDAN